MKDFALWMAYFAVAIAGSVLVGQTSRPYIGDWAIAAQFAVVLLCWAVYFMLQGKIDEHRKSNQGRSVSAGAVTITATSDRAIAEHAHASDAAEGAGAGLIEETWVGLRVAVLFPGGLYGPAICTMRHAPLSETARCLNGGGPGAPVLGCSCGWYAMRGDVPWQTVLQPHMCYEIVRAVGKTIVHESGWRAERIQTLALLPVANIEDPWTAELRRAISIAWGLPVVHPAAVDEYMNSIFGRDMVAP